MFTGIIQGTAIIMSVYKQKNFHKYTIYLPNDFLDELKIGSSIACNGCCLTVTKINGNYINVDVIQETLRVTNLCTLELNDIINVERAVKFGDEIGGHLMSGHIMTTAEIKDILITDYNRQLWFELKNISLLKYVLYKGFIGIDGISLTVGQITSTQFCVYLIPETLQRTTLGIKKLGQHVNIEIDFQTQTIVDTVENILKVNNDLAKIKNTN